MKKFLANILVLTTILLLCISVFAKENTFNETYTIIINNKSLNLNDLPFNPYKNGDTIMVPLRKIGEALGYRVGWNSETQAITIDDDYIQKELCLMERLLLFSKANCKS